MYKIKFVIMMLLAAIVMINSGCAVNFHKGLPSDQQKIDELKGEIDKLESDLTLFGKEKEKELEQLKQAKALLESRLRSEIRNKEVTLNMAKKGLVITMVEEVLFDSGKAKLRKEVIPILDKVARVLNESVGNRDIGVEGHTDNVPIKYSGWKSNWELSTARATSVLHYLVNKGVAESRLAAIGYGEHRPVADNSTKEGRQQNRRVEIVILPTGISKIDFETTQKKQAEDENWIK